MTHHGLEKEQCCSNRLIFALQDDNESFWVFGDVSTLTRIKCVLWAVAVFISNDNQDQKSWNIHARIKSFSNLDKCKVFRKLCYSMHAYMYLPTSYSYAYGI